MILFFDAGDNLRAVRLVDELVARAVHQLERHIREAGRAKRPGEKFGRHIRKKRDFHMLLGTSGGHLLKIE